MRTLALLKPGVSNRAQAFSEAVSAAQAAGLQLTWTKRILLSQNDAERFYGAHRGRFFFQRLVLFLSNQTVDVMVFEGPQAVSIWRNLIGPTHRKLNRNTQTLRGRHAFSDTRNAFHGSGTADEAAEEIRFFQSISIGEKD